MTDPTDAEARAAFLKACDNCITLKDYSAEVGHALLQLTRERDEAKSAGYQMHVHDSSPGLELEVVALRERVAALEAERDAAQIFVDGWGRIASMYVADPIANAVGLEDAVKSTIDTLRMVRARLSALEKELADMTATALSHAGEIVEMKPVVEAAKLMNAEMGHRGAWLTIPCLRAVCDAVDALRETEK